MRTFFIHVGAGRVHLLAELRRLGLEVVFFTTNDAPKPEVYAEMAPGVPFITNAHAQSGRSPLLGPPPPARLEDIQGIAASEQVALHCFDRSNAAGRSMIELHSLYLEHVGRWRAILSRYDPEVLVFSDNPHHGWDNVLYALARLDGRKTAIIGYTELERRVIVKSRIHEAPGPTAEEVDQAVASARAVAEVSRDANNLRSNQRTNDLRRIRWKTSLLGAARLMVGLKQFQRTPPMGLFFLGDETPRYIKVRWTLFQNRLVGRQLFQAWQSLARNVSVAEPFVYLPLPMQPESTTVPLAGEYSDQLTLTRVVAEALPQGWKLYVKEHPAQLVWNLASRGRTVDYYRRLAQIPRVSLISLEVNGGYLAGKARAVATATGTTGFEAIEAGVPAVVFSTPWYAKAPGVIQVRTVEQCRDALGKIQRGEATVDRDRLRVFKHLMAERYTVEAIFDSETALANDKAPVATAARLAKAIRQVIDRQTAGGPVEDRLKA